MFLFYFIEGQVPGFIWTKQFGSTTTDIGRSVTTDALGNVYSTGHFTGVSDFDPGIGVFNMTSTGSEDIFISKVDPSGNFIWAKQIGGSGSDVGYSISIDSNGDVYLAGFFNGTSDFDPGTGVYNLTSAGVNDIYVLKLNSTGIFVWAKRMGSTGDDYAISLAVDANNVYTTGYFEGTVDFDPGTGIFNLTSSGNNDCFVSKLDALGNFVWARKFGGTQFDNGSSITVDATGNVYTTGPFMSTVDFDPGAGVFNLTAPSGGTDVFISKLNSSGNFVWAKQFTGPTLNRVSYGISLDAAGNVLIAGNFDSTSDFDPGTGFFNLSPFSANVDDIFITKLDASGNFVWAKQLGGTGNDRAFSICTDVAGNVYSGGYFNSIADFDPNAGIYNLNSSGGSDAFISKLNSSGNFVWAIQISGASSQYVNSVTLDLNNSVLAIGYHIGTSDFDPNASVFNLSSTGVADVFIEKLCQLPPLVPGLISGLNSICFGSTNSYSLSPVSEASGYTWNLPSGWTGASSSNTITGTSGASGIFTVTASNACGSSPQQTLNVTVNPLPTITVNSGSICAGSSFTIVPGGANTYTIQGGSAVVSPTTTNSYTVIGTSSAGCASSSFATSSVIVNSLPTITVNSGSICSGQSFTIMPSGASTYTFSGGPIVTPTTSSSYSVTGTSSAGCTSSTYVISNVTVNPLPTISVSSSTNQLCIGSAATLSATGASSYTWNPSGTGSSIVISPTVNTTYTVTGMDANGCQNTSTITQNVTNCGSMGLSSLSAEASATVDVFPNPFNDIITISFSRKISIPIQVFDIFGSMICETITDSSRTEIDLSKYSSGFYFIKIGNVTRKVIKE
jgi:hypothetical protein